jgi:hypothetical protein
LHRACVFALGVVALVGCQEVVRTAPLRVEVRGPGLQGEPVTPLQGLELCQTGTTNCVLSDANGQIIIDLPIDQESSCTLEKEGYERFLVPVFLSAMGGQGGFTLGTVQSSSDVYDRLMSPYPPKSTGSIGLGVEPRVAGVMFQLLNGTGKAYYSSDEGWSLDLTETTSRGTGGFLEVSPGTFEVVYSGTPESCRLLTWAWPSDLENGVRFPVRAGYTTWAELACSTP